MLTYHEHHIITYYRAYFKVGLTQSLTPSQKKNRANDNIIIMYSRHIAIYTYVAQYYDRHCLSCTAAVDLHFLLFRSNIYIIICIFF